MLRKANILLIAFVLLLTVMTAGCIQTVEAPPSSSETASPGLPPATASPGPSEGGASPSGFDAPEEFRALLTTPGNEKAAIDALGNILPGLPAGDAAGLVTELEAYQNDAISERSIVDERLAALIRSGLSEPYDEKALNDLDAIRDFELKEALRAVFDRGYKLIVPEGMYQAVINYGAYRQFENYLTPDMAAYIEIMASESDSRMAEDGGIVIPMDDVFMRALACESFMSAYPDSELRHEMKEMYCWYIDAYFYGLDNTPAFDYETNKLRQEFLDSYQKVMEGPEESALIKAKDDYYKILQQSDFTLTPAVSDYRKSLTNQLKNTSVMKG